MNTTANPSAFPLLERGGDGLELTEIGLSMRDYFAAKALGGLLVGVSGVTPENNAEVLGLIAGAAYDIADAMLAARSKT